VKAKIKCRGITVELKDVTRYSVKNSEKDNPLLEVYNGNKRIASFPHWSYIILESEESG